MNTVQVIGNLARDPQIRATKTGRSVASFSIAVNRQYTTPSGEQRELTDWINIVAWGYLAEAVGNQLRKGTRVFVEGRLSTRSYDTPDGQRRYVTEVVANTIAIPLGTSGRGNASAGMPQQTAGAMPAASPMGQSSNNNFSQFGTTRTDEDIPF